jgi:Streptomyces sporulation and cell division protein, SsgA
MEHRSSSRYSCPLTLQLISSRSSSEIPALFSYDARDPYAVRITFGSPHVDFEDAVTWLIGRELLHAGLHQPSGEGDVQVGPTAARSEVLFLHLHTPSGEAHLELSRAALATFLSGTETLVPFGAEGATIDFDKELAIILSKGDADPFSR